MICFSMTAVVPSPHVLRLLSTLLSAPVTPPQVNNAGTNPAAKPFLDFHPHELERVVSTNMLGSLLCTRHALRQLSSQSGGGHVFTMEGAGSSGSATPRYAAYGATKSGLRQLQASLREEGRGGGVGVHTASPGMVLTDLLLRYG